MRKPEYLCVRYFYAIVVVGSAAYLLERRHIILLPRCIWRRRSSPHSAQGVGEGGRRRFWFFILTNRSDQIETQNQDHHQVVSFQPRQPSLVTSGPVAAIETTFWWLYFTWWFKNSSIDWVPILQTQENTLLATPLSMYGESLTTPDGTLLRVLHVVQLSH